MLASQLEHAHIEAATAPRWHNVAYRGAVTSFRDRAAAVEYAARVKIRFGVTLVVYVTDTVPGYDH